MSAGRGGGAKRAEKQARKGQSAGKAGKGGGAPEVKYGPPLKPRPKLLAILCVAFALWVGVLIAMYLGTVYPQRSKSMPTTTTAQGDR